MKKLTLILAVSVSCFGAWATPTAFASTKQNGSCVGFAGASSGHKYAGIKCYLDSEPGDWVINTSILERNDAKGYQNLLRVPKRPFRCTLTKASVTIVNGVETTLYDLANCSL